MHMAAVSMRRTRRPVPEAMTLIEHLGELRRRLMICLSVFVVTSVFTYFFYGVILHFLEHPYCLTVGAHHACALYVTGPLDAFAIRLNVMGYGGLALASPILLFELWRFITPGLRAHERKFALPFVVASTSLFAMGAAIAWLTFPHVLGFLHAAGGPGIQDIFSPAKYVSLILALMAIFGLTFQFPVVLVALELAHVTTPERLSHFRRVAIVLIVLVAAVITPSSDPFSMLAMAVPMLIFYEMSIAIGRVASRRTQKINSASEATGVERIVI
jgi:sec-independent protein translocase protein TatC